MQVDSLLSNYKTHILVCVSFCPMQWNTLCTYFQGIDQKDISMYYVPIYSKMDVGKGDILRL